MPELIRLEIAEMPELCLVGRELRVDMKTQTEHNPIPAFWDDCMRDGTLGPLERQEEFLHSPDYFGLMTDWDFAAGEFSYTVGMLMKPGCAVPDGYTQRKLGPCRACVSWIRGKDTMDVAGPAHEMTEDALRARGETNESMSWCMEGYNCPRYTTPDANGTITMDYYIPLD